MHYNNHKHFDYLKYMRQGDDTNYYSSQKAEFEGLDKQ